MSPLLEEFLQEGKECLEEFSRHLLALEKQPGESRLLDSLFRRVHTLKGNAGLFGFEPLKALAHAAEDVLDAVRGGGVQVEQRLVDALLEAGDLLMRMLGEIEAREQIAPESAEEAESLAGRIRALWPAHRGLPAAAAETPSVAPPRGWGWIGLLPEEARRRAFDAGLPLHGLRYVPEPECFFKGEDPLLLVERAPGLVGVAVEAAEPWPPLERMDVYRCNLAFDALSCAGLDQLREHFQYVGEQVVLYPVCREALAVPEAAGLQLGGSPFLAEVGRAFAEGGPAGAADAARRLVAAGAAADAGECWAAHWITRFAECGVPASAMGVLLEALKSGSLPDWKRWQEEQAPAGAAAAGSAALASPAAAGPPIRALALEIVSAQRELLGRDCPEEERPGRLQSVASVVEAVSEFFGIPASLPSLAGGIGDPDGVEGQGGLLRRLDTLEACLKAAGGEAGSGGPAGEGGASRAEPSCGASGENVREADRTAARQVTLRVPVAKIDALMELASELVVAKNALPYLAERAEREFSCPALSRELKLHYAGLHRLIEELQAAVQKVRMVPLGSVFQRFPRLVRDLSAALGKDVQLVLEGEETEVDKNIAEILPDPLIHILRNSLDHGLELPEEREQAGKPRRGTIRISARQEGGRVMIEAEDDGRGILAQEVLAAAYRKGLISEQQAESYGEEQALQLLFVPGFSTAGQVSELSGRGVGMDVVRRTVEQVGGAVQLKSAPGKGTSVVLTVPVSMMVSRVLEVEAGGQRFGIPLEQVTESLRVRRSSIHCINGTRVFLLRGSTTPLYSLSELVGASPQREEEDSGLGALTIVVRKGEALAGITLSRLVQAVDVVIKPLGGPLAGLRTYRGTALLGDGSILPILNLEEIL